MGNRMLWDIWASKIIGGHLLQTYSGLIGVMRVIRSKIIIGHGELQFGNVN